MNTQQFDKALDLINELNDQVGKSDIRDNYKAQILQDAKYQGPEKANLIEQIKKNPKEETKPEDREPDDKDRPTLKRRTGGDQGFLP